MKKIYVLIVVCLGISFAGVAQTYYWVGPTNGNWNSSANWSSSSGGAGGAGVPNGLASNVIFNSAGAVNLDINADLNTLTVTNSSTVRITATGGGFVNRTLTVNSTSAGTPGLQIDAGSRLEDSTQAATTFEFIFPDNGQGVINGQWYLTGNSVDDISTFTLPQISGQTTRLHVNNNASITVTGNAYMPTNSANAIPYLRFNAGSFLYLTGNGSVIPKATYNVASTISITGITDVGVVIDEKADLGNVIYNCPGQTMAFVLGLIGINIDGDLQILNTNNRDLTLISNGTALNTTINVVVKGNLNISGNSSVVVSKLNANNKVINLFVDGNLVAGGNKFDLQSSTTAGIQPTTIFLKGNLQHTAGTFGASSNIINESLSLYVVEMSGTAAQTISSVTGNIDNANNQVTLRMNNAAGVSLLSPLKTGRINFNTTNHGRLTTTATNILTLQNTSGNSIVVNSPGNLGFVNGPVRRMSASTSAVVIPTGTGSTYRQLIITPSSATATTYEANLIAVVHPGAKLSPLSGIADYYWNLTRFAGTADATIQMTINGAVPGAQSTDALVAAKFDGTNWVVARGTTGTSVNPGNSASGAVTSELQTTFSLFSIGYGLASSLPINLLSFTGRKFDKSAQLSWKVTESSSPVKFDVMRSADGKTFIAVGSLNAAEGKLNYTFNDNGITAGNNYYRLKMFDKDGSVSYSNVIVIMNGSKGILISSMIPTIVINMARLNISSSLKGSMQLVVTDINGRVMQNQVIQITEGNQEVWLNAATLAAGIFQVTGYINGERTATMRFIKQ